VPSYLNGAQLAVDARLAPRDYVGLFAKPEGVFEEELAF
jgi:hypothetical protein